MHFIGVAGINFQNPEAHGSVRRLTDGRVGLSVPWRIVAGIN